MRRVLAITLRAAWITISFVIAAYTAGAIIAISDGSLWAPRDGFLWESPAAFVQLGLYVGITGAFVGKAFLIPAIVAITAAEIFRVQTALSHLLGGLAVAIAAGVSTYIVPQVHVSEARGWEILLAAGVLSGAVYWLVAGRSSGRWQDVGEPLGRRGTSSKNRDEADHQTALE